MKNFSNNIHMLIFEIKRRWLRKVLQMGLSVVLITLLLFLIIFFSLILLFEISSLIQSLIIALTLVLILVEVGWLVLRPIIKGFDAKRIALLVEEKNPDLEDRLNSAVEIDDMVNISEKNILIEKLLDDALKKMKSVHLSSVLNRKNEKILSYGALTILILFFLFSFRYRNELKNAVSFVHISLNPKTHFSQEIIQISPGNVQIEKGESLEIIATLKKETENEFSLYFKPEKAIWQKTMMESGLDQKMFLYRFLNIQEPLKYYVETTDLRSPEYTVTIYEFPKVLQIDLKYTYPAYTRMPVYYEEDTGNIRGLKGTEVTLSVATSGIPETSEIVLNSSETIKLEHIGNGMFQGTLVIKNPSSYFIKLTDREGKNNKFPQEYQINAIDDELPYITIIDPQRDVRVNAIEEVLLSISVSDDYGVNSTLLKYSVNGLNEKSINLLEQSSRGEKEIFSSHIFYLEDFTLEAGDVISYYLEAEDNFHRDNPALSDMYFIEITPFDANYRQVNNQGGGAPGGSGGSQMVMNQQTIINATWNLLRTRGKLSPTEFKENIRSLEQAQLNLKNNIEQRIQETVFSLEMVTDEESREILDLLRSSVEQMAAAAEKLHDGELREALTPERKALNFLLKADARNKERMVQRQQMAAGGGGSGSQMEERMTELMDLELDISKDKYEIQQQNTQQRSQEMDEALRKLQELAKKQQKLAQNSRETLQRESLDRRQLERLKRDQEDLRQEAENLARQIREMSRTNEQISRQMQERIEQIAEMLRKSEQEMKSDNIQKSMTQQHQALNELERLQQSIGSSLTDNNRELLEEFLQDFKSLDQKERQHGQELQEILDQVDKNRGKIPDLNVLKDLVEKRQQIIDELNTLEDQASLIEKQAQQENPNLSTQFRNIQNTIRRENIEKNMKIAKELVEKGWLTYANMVEEEIQMALQNIEEELGEFESGIPQTAEEKLNRSLEDTRELMRRFQETFAQADRDPDGSERSETPQNRTGESGQQNPQDQEQQNQGGSRNGNRNSDVRLNRLLEQTQQMLDRIERDFREDSGVQQALENFRRAYTPRIRGELLGEKAEDYFKRGVYDPLSQLELELLRLLDEIELEKKLYGMRKEEVPPEYRKMVNKYFESISK